MILSVRGAETSVQPTHAPGPADAGKPGPARRTARQVTAIVGVLALAVFMSSLDLFIVNLAFPYIGRDYPDTSLASLSWVLNAYTIVFAAVLVPAGRWADRAGRRRIFVTGLIGFTAGSALCGLSPGVPELIAARVIQAAGAGLMVPASLSLLLASVPLSGRAKAIGTWSAFGALGAALGPVIGGALVQLSWRWVFWINIPVGLLAVLLATRIVPESRDEHSRGKPDLAGATLLAAAVGLVAFALVKAPYWGWGSARFIAVLTASLACGAVMIWRSRRHHSPVIELGLLRSRTFSGTFAASILYYAAFGAFVLNSVEFLTGVWHYSAIQAGLAIGPGPLMVLPFARVVAPRLAGRRAGPRRHDRLPGQRRCHGPLAGTDPGPAGLPDAPAAGPAAGRRWSRPGNPIAARRGQPLAQPGPVRNGKRNPQHGPPGRHGPRRRGPGRHPGRPRPGAGHHLPARDRARHRVLHGGRPHRRDHAGEQGRLGVSARRRGGRGPGGGKPMSKAEQPDRPRHPGHWAEAGQPEQPEARRAPRPPATA